MEILLYSEILEVDTAGLCLSNAAHTELILSNTVRAPPILTVRLSSELRWGIFLLVMEFVVVSCFVFMTCVQVAQPVHLHHYDARTWHFDVDSQRGMTAV